MQQMMGIATVPAAAPGAPPLAPARGRPAVGCVVRSFDLAAGKSPAVPLVHCIVPWRDANFVDKRARGS